MLSRTNGCGPGAFTQGELARAPPGAVGGRGVPVIPFHGHIESLRLWPIRFPPFATLLSKDSPRAESKRLNFLCHLAHSRSTLACSRKNNGSLAAVEMLEMDPPKETWAHPCGLPSM